MISFNDVYRLEQRLTEELDLRIGCIASRWAIRNFKDKYDDKHYEEFMNLEDGNGSTIKYEYNRMQTMKRYLNLYYKI